MIIQLDNCSLEIGLVYEQSHEVITDGPLAGLGCRMEARIWPEI